MAKPILRVGKIKKAGASTLGSVGSHLHRTRDTPNADPARSGANRVLIGGAGGSLDEAVAGVMGRARIDPARLRKDATVANDIVLSVSPEWFRPDDPERHGYFDPARLAQFEAATTAFLRDTFGARVAQAVLHVDEATPHVHAVVVPILKGQEGYRLSGKDMFGPDALSALQQAWEDALQPLGVGQRLKGSRARHTTLKEFYGSLDAFKTERQAKPVEISSPPAKAFLEGSAAHQGRVDEWRRSEAKRLRAERRPLEIAASRGRLYEAERLAGAELRSLASEQAEEVGRLREMVADANTQAERSKAEIAALRGAPLNEVAALLGYSGEVGPRENAIDLTMRIGGLNYRESLAWLAQRLGPETAATAAREHVAQRLPEIAAAPVATKSEKFKARVVGEQLDALAAPAYRITVMRMVDGKQVGQNLGKSKEDGPERTWSRDDVVALLPQLTTHNVRGGNIFVTPLDPAAWHVLADDLTADGLATIKARGYAPAAVLETSPGNHQAVLKLPKSAADKEAVNRWFKDLNRDLGDAKITGLTHPFRLAGFENRKDKHQQPDGRFPFVRLVEAVNRACARSVAIVRSYARQHQQGPGGPRR